MTIIDLIHSGAQNRRYKLLWVEFILFTTWRLTELVIVLVKKSLFFSLPRTIFSSIRLLFLLPINIFSELNIVMFIIKLFNVMKSRIRFQNVPNIISDYYYYYWWCLLKLRFLCSSAFRPEIIILHPIYSQIKQSNSIMLLTIVIKFSERAPLFVYKRTVEM